MLNRKLTLAVSAALLCAPLAQAQTWTVVAAESGSIVNANLPGASRSITDYLYGDTGNDQFSFRVTAPTASIGYWANRAGVLTQYAATGSNGVLGPGRSGAESAHQFLNLYGSGGAGAGGQRSFIARAGDPAVPAGISYGAWRWDTNRNVEIARTFVSDALGPGLPGWIFPNASDFADLRSMDGGKALLDTSVTNSTSGATSRLIVKHVPGLGNQPCVRAGATEAALAPGLTPGDSFQTPWGMGNLSVSTTGRVYANLNASGSRGGIWEICNGAPRALAADDDDGPLGPDFGVDTAQFINDFYPAFPAQGGHIYFFASFRDTPNVTSRLGLFWNNDAGSGNKPLAMNEATGFHGPNWESTTWKNFTTNTLSVGGRYAAFYACVDTPDNGDPCGYWRVQPGQRPELVALQLSVPGPFGPEAGRTWRSFGASAVLPNGDLLLEAATDPNNETDLWLLEPGKAPRRILRVGQPITFQTTGGPVTANVSSFDLSNGGAAYARGIDSWVGADGSVAVVATLSGYGEVLLRSRPSDRIFKDGFN
ncbi:hypothetical protein [Tahibacter harae]|uniref:DUF4185 domain-containing protein n=1 Tax=Tahibacter harae TaxID=2963937 RepID=A0ABT1QRM8_9GAMM|nr:hypothetical protein [Tahibacter harae]MCQ4164962.1 hypothetical protein [Tahibacter harae]